MLPSYSDLRTATPKAQGPINELFSRLARERRHDVMPHHARLVNAMPPDVIDYLLWYFRARPGPGFSEHGWLPSVSLAEVDVGQADVVLALIRAPMGLPHFMQCAEGLMGRAIRHCPPCLRLPYAQMEFPDPEGEEARRLTFVARNPRLPTTDAFYRYRVMKTGMTVQQCLVRGAKKRDIRLALRKGWIRLEENDVDRRRSKNSRGTGRRSESGRRRLQQGMHGSKGRGTDSHHVVRDRA